MFPSFFGFYSSNVAFANIELPRNLACFPRIVSYFKHFFFSQFCGPKSFSVSVATLFDRIVRIVGARPQEKMLGINTSTIIARMANAETFGNKSMLKLPGKPVGRMMYSCGIDSPVAKNGNASKPDMALRPSVFLYEIIKFFSEWCYRSAGTGHFNHLRHGFLREKCAAASTENWFSGATLSRDSQSIFVEADYQQKIDWQGPGIGSLSKECRSERDSISYPKGERR